MKKLKLKIQDLTNHRILSSGEISKITGGNEYTVWHCEYSDWERGMVPLPDCYGEYSKCIQDAQDFCNFNVSICQWAWCSF